MSNILSSHKTGLAFGGLLGLWHLCWSFLVAFGLAQPLINFIFELHMIRPLYMIGTFSFSMAIGLIIVTSLIGYAFGYVFATIWNAVHK